MESKKYIGMDVHQASISVAVRDDVGKLVMECIIETKAATVLEFIGRRPDRSGKLITAVHGYSTPPPAGWLAAIHRGSLSEPIDPESP
jgi:hypothetical protein